MLARIDAILRREQKTDEHKDQKFAELGKYEVRKQGYRRLGYKSFEGFPEAKFADSRCKAIRCRPTTTCPGSRPRNRGPGLDESPGAGKGGAD